VSVQLHKAIDILELIEAAERPMALGAIAERVGMSKPAAHRLLQVLVERGYVEQDPETQNYLATLRMAVIGFGHLAATGMREVTYPELLEQVGCEQNQWHAYDVWDHTMRVLDESSGEPAERIAALLHDVAKPRTRARSDKTNDWTFYHHEKIGADMAAQWLRDYRFSNQERELIVDLIRHHLICYASEWTDAAVRRFIKRVGPSKVEPLLRLGEADAVGKGRNVEQELAALRELRRRIDEAMEEGSALSTQDLAVDGNDVIALLEGGAGPVVGQILRALLERVIEDPSLNTRDKLLPLVEQLGETLARPK